MKEGAFDGASLTAIATPFARKGLFFCRFSTNGHTTQVQQKTKSKISKCRIVQQVIALCAGQRCVWKGLNSMRWIWLDLAVLNYLQLRSRSRLRKGWEMGAQPIAEEDPPVAATPWAWGFDVHVRKGEPCCVPCDCDVSPWAMMFASVEVRHVVRNAAANKKQNTLQVFARCNLYAACRSEEQSYGWEVFF